MGIFPHFFPFLKCILPKIEYKRPAVFVDFFAGNCQGLITFGYNKLKSMQKNNLLTLILCTLFLPLLRAQNAGDVLVIKPLQPKSGENILFQFNVEQTSLSRTADLEVVALQYDGTEVSTIDAYYTQQGNSVSGMLYPNTGALGIALAIHKADVWYNNNGNGIFVPICNGSGTPYDESAFAKIKLLYENYAAFGLNRKPGVTVENYQAAMERSPKLKTKYRADYTKSLLNNKRNEASQALVPALIDEIEKDANATENERKLAINWLSNAKLSDRAKDLRDKTKALFPKGAFAFDEQMSQVAAEKDLAKREELTAKLQQDFPDNGDMILRLWNPLLQSYGKDKNWAKYDQLLQNIPEHQRPTALNSVAWDLAEKNENLDIAEKYAAEAVRISEAQLYKPSGKKPALTSMKSWEQNRKYTLANFIDTYAYVLSKKGALADAIKQQKRCVELYDRENTELNDRYIEFLDKANSPELRYEAEGLVLAGKAGKGTEELLKKAYLSEDKTEAGYESHVKALKNVAFEHHKAELAGQKLNTVAPNFTLTDLNGQSVSLESLKNKIVIVDFWATWCGPCKASFPGMQMVVDKYKNDPDVAVVFLDCWENGTTEEKVKKVSEFIQNNHYTFRVLMDNENKVVEDFGVSGIPTKFILDKSGKLQFKAVGYGGSSEGLVDELDIMISLLR